MALFSKNKTTKQTDISTFKQFELVDSAVDEDLSKSMASSEEGEQVSMTLSQTEKELAHGTSQPKGFAKTLKNTATQPLVRVSKEELEIAYQTDEIVFNSINKYVQVIMGGKISLVAKDEKVKKFYLDFFENIGNTGDMISWPELLEATLVSTCVYGWQPIENVFGESEEEIIDWRYVDPKTIDYAKDSQKNILVDKKGNPVGYTQELPSSVSISSRQTDPVPRNANLPNNSIYLDAKRISLIKLYEVGNRAYPLGIVEPIYQPTKRKGNMAEALTQAIYRHGFPVIWATVGDINHQPTPTQIDDMLKKLKTLSYKNEIATPYYYKVELLEGKHVDKLQNYLTYSINQQIAGLGIPAPYATGSGEGSNRSTLDNQSRMFKLVLEDIWKKVSSSIRRTLFKPLSESQGFDEVPILQMEFMGVDELQNKHVRLLGYVKEGILSPEQLEEYVKEAEDLHNLPEIDLVKLKAKVPGDKKGAPDANN